MRKVADVLKEIPALPALEILNTPIGPTLSPIKILHRHKDGYIAFAVKDEEQWRSVVSIRADALDSMFPEIREQLLKDSLVGINASYKCKGPKGKLCGFPLHQADSIRYLCACYVDIDFYRKGLTFNETQKIVADKCDAGVLPRPSIFVDSAHGMWLLWLLHDPDNQDQAHYGWPENLILHARINQAIRERLADLGADPAACDVTRHLRLDGSFRTSTERYVRWQIHLEGNRINSYTLSELAAFLAVKSPKRSQIEREILADKPRTDRWKGHRQANANRLKAFMRLQELRGGFDEGMRAKATYIYAAALKANRTEMDEALRQVLELGRHCRPALTQADCIATVKDAYKRRGPRNLRYATMAEWLCVTSAEAEIISQTIHKPFPCAKSLSAAANIQPEENRQTRNYQREIRRTVIRCIVAKTGRVPSLREMKALLIGHGIEASYVTIRADYIELGFESEGKMRLQENAKAKARQVQLIA